MWDLIINPFTTLLTLLYSIFNNNIVLAIIVFTILIRLLTYPLTIQQQRSSKAVQELQPKLKALQEKYKNDREKLSQEQMKLYREHGVNPFGGCLPLLIQLPILLALYQAIIHSLAGTPYQLIDLSSRLLLPGLDHLVPLNKSWLGMDLTLAPGQNPPIAYILPVLVLITTWFQSKMTVPATPKRNDGQPDQTQAMTQSMTTIMPIMFGFFALNFSVGLSVYFIVSNLIGIVQYGAMGKVDLRSVLGLKPKEPGAAPSLMEGSKPKGKEKPKRIEAKAKPSKKASK
jgi:YidC/Oxa1 family membrane protein insertase